MWNCRKYNEWGRQFLFLQILLLMVTSETNSQMNMNPDYLNLSIELLEGLKENKDVTKILNQIASSTQEELISQLNTDDKKFTFWINIYNGFILSILKDHPEYYNDRQKFFKKPFIKIGGQTLSFSVIEHGIIRRSQWELGLGYFSKWFPPNYEKLFRPNKKNYRVHFALNCGAKSCPPVAILRPETINMQFETLESAYLKKITTYDINSNVVTTTPLCSWFRGDFGGKSGVKKILLNQKLIPSTNVDLKFGDYDWTLDLDNFVE